MPEKIKVGGVIKNDCLASISVLAVKDQPGIAAAILDALGQRRHERPVRGAGHRPRAAGPDGAVRGSR